METDGLNETHTAVTETIDRLKEIQTQMHQQYKDYTEKNKTSKVFGLDSFHYQCRLLDLNLKQLNEQYAFINNRMYCDYYKLFKIIIDYVFQNIPDKKLIELIHVNDHFPVYKDLEPFKQYDFQYIQSLHENVVVILLHLHGYISKKEHDLHMYQIKKARLMYKYMV
jgi:hypothetical protein